MKLLISVLALSFSLTSFASTGETKTFNYDGSQDSAELLLRGEKTHTEYKVEDIPSTCYRQEIIGYNTICNGGYYGPGYPRPYPGPYYPGPYYPGPYSRQCYQTPIYRTIPYSCIRTVRTAFEVKDFDVDTKVILNVVNSSELAASEKFSVTLLGDKLTIMMNGSKKLIGVLKNEAIKAQMAGSVKVINVIYDVELVDAQAVASAARLTKISMSRGLLTLKAGRLADRGDLTLSLQIVNKKALAEDIVMLDRELTKSEYSAEAEDGSATNITVDTNVLGVQINGGKYSITARIFFKGKVLNRIELPELEASRTLIYKN